MISTLRVNDFETDPGKGSGVTAQNLLLTMMQTTTNAGLYEKFLLEVFQSNFYMHPFRVVGLVIGGWGRF